MPAASDVALSGRRVAAKEALELRLIHSIAKSPDSVLAETLEKAKQISMMSPDGIIVTRAALRETWETASIEQAFRLVHETYFEKLMKGPNSAEGLAAFREKKKPGWKSSRL